METKVTASRRAAAVKGLTGSRKAAALYMILLETAMVTPDADLSAHFARCKEAENIAWAAVTEAHGDGFARPVHVAPPGTHGHCDLVDNLVRDVKAARGILEKVASIRDVFEWSFKDNFQRLAPIARGAVAAHTDSVSLYLQDRKMVPSLLKVTVTSIDFPTPTTLLRAAMDAASNASHLAKAAEACAAVAASAAISCVSARNKPDAKRHAKITDIACRATWQHVRIASCNCILARLLAWAGKWNSKALPGGRPLDEEKIRHDQGDFFADNEALARHILQVQKDAKIAMEVVNHYLGIFDDGVDHMEAHRDRKECVGGSSTVEASSVAQSEQTRSLGTSLTPHASAHAAASISSPPMLSTATTTAHAAASGASMPVSLPVPDGPTHATRTTCPESVLSPEAMMAIKIGPLHSPASSSVVSAMELATVLWNAKIAVENAVIRAIWAKDARNGMLFLEEGDLAMRGAASAIDATDSLFSTLEESDVARNPYIMLALNLGHQIDPRSGSLMIMVPGFPFLRMG